MTHSGHDPPAPSGPHSPVQPANGGLARLVGSVSAASKNKGLARSVWDKVDMAYRQLQNIRDTAGSLFNARPVQPPAPTPEQANARAKQSDRILVRLLARQMRYSEIAQLAARTDCEEIASMAIVRLIEAEDDQVGLIEELARGDSKAASAALFGLLNTGYIELAREIFVERMEDGSLCCLVQSGLTSAFTLVAFVGGLDKAAGLHLSSVYFDAIWSSVKDSEPQLMKLLGEILGDPDPLAGRCVPTPSEVVPQEIKLMAISLLDVCSPTHRERCLCYATADPDETVARLATNLLIECWGSQEGRVPPGVFPFAMLEMNLLFHLCNMSAAFKWPSVVDFSVYERDLERLQDELEELRRKQTGPVGPFDGLREKTLEAQIAGLAKEVDGIVERRLRSLQALVNSICALLNVPNPKLEVRQGSFMAAYVIGRGCIAVTGKLFVDDKPLSIDLMSALLHEIGHMEQDMLVIRLMCDDLGLIFGQHSHLLRPLMERYAHAIGYAPDPMFLLAVLRLRNDRLLTPVDRMRATRLIEASYKTEHGHHTGRLMEARLDHLDKSLSSLSSGACDGQMLSCLADSRLVESLFKQGQIPGVVLEEIGECQRQFVEIMTNYLKQNYPGVTFMRSRSAVDGSELIPLAVIEGRRYGLIDLAGRLLGRVNIEPLEWIVERLKHLLVEVLKEESVILRARLSEIRREGYHEEEAYIISDRAEVTVKALQKGWYRVT